MGLPQLWSFFRKPPSSYQVNVSAPYLLTFPCSLWFPSATEIRVWAASHERRMFSSCSSQPNRCNQGTAPLPESDSEMASGPSTLGTWLLLPQFNLPSHSAMLGCQVFHLGNTWHFQPQGLSTDAISKIIFLKATNILNS